MDGGTNCNWYVWYSDEKIEKGLKDLEVKGLIEVPVV